jgi:serine/threonine-protein kinase
VDAGDRVGPWEVSRPLGEGGVGEVYLASHIETGAKGALKVLKAVKDQAAMARFRREMQALAKLRHHAIVKLVDSDLTHPSRPWLVMEHIPGDSLESVIERGPMHPQACLRAFAALADGLAQAHAYGIHHRDVKSNNVIVQHDGTMVLVDFGAAIEDDSSQVTHAGLLLGTTRYLAPEVVCGDERDNVMADIYALGMLCYEALTGSHAFRGPKGEVLRFHQVLSSKMKLDHLDPGPGFADEVRKVIRLTTDKNPDKRINRMDDLADMLEVASGVGGHTPMMSLRQSERLAELRNRPPTPTADPRRRRPPSRPEPRPSSEPTERIPDEDSLAAQQTVDRDGPSPGSDAPGQGPTVRLERNKPTPVDSALVPDESRGFDWVLFGALFFLFIGLLTSASILGVGVVVFVTS